MPETIVAMLQARIGLLPAAARRAVRAASVFGEIFPLAGVEALTGGADDDLPASLALLSRSEIVERHEESRWRFRHVLMRDAAYDLFTDEDRAESHLAAAHHLERLGDDPAVVGAHWERGGDWPRAVRAYLAAAEAGYRRADHQLVKRLVALALAAGASGEERGVLRAIEVPSLYYLDEFAAAWEGSTEALELLPPGHPKRLPTLCARTYCSAQIGKFAEVETLLEEMLAIDPRTQDRAEYMSALGHGGIAYIVLGHRDRSLRLLGRMADLDEQVGATDPQIRGQSRYWHLRYLEIQGDDQYAPWVLAREATHHLRLSGDRRIHACSLVEVGECARRLYSVEDGVLAMREAVRLAGELREPITESFILHYLAALLAEHGAREEQAEARALAQAAIDLAGPGTAYRGLAQMAMAYVCLRAGELTAAEVHARESQAAIRKLGIRGLYGQADVALMRVLLHVGDPGAAAVADEALENVSVLGTAGLHEIPVRLNAARAHLVNGRRPDAERGVAEALAVFHRRAALIPEPEIRARFSTHVPEHVELFALARQLGVPVRSSS